MPVLDPTPQALVVPAHAPNTTYLWHLPHIPAPHWLTHLWTTPYIPLTSATLLFVCYTTTIIRGLRAYRRKRAELPHLPPFPRRVVVLWVAFFFECSYGLFADSDATFATSPAWWRGLIGATPFVLPVVAGVFLWMLCRHDREVERVKKLYEKTREGVDAGLEMGGGNGQGAYSDEVEGYEK